MVQPVPRDDFTTEQLANKCSHRVEGEEYWKVSPFDASGNESGTPDNPIYVSVAGSQTGTPFLANADMAGVVKDTETLIYKLEWTDAAKNLGITAIRCKGGISALFKVLLTKATPTPDTFKESKFSDIPSNEAEFRYWALMRLEIGDKLEIYVKHKYGNPMCFQSIIMGEELAVT